MLKIEQRDAAFELVIYCDWCGKQIEDAKDARYEWLLTREGQLHNGGQLFYAHQQCSPIADRYESAPLTLWHSEPLEDFPDKLAASLQLNAATLDPESSMKKLD